MARKVQVVLEDDLNGGVAAETVPFSLDGRSYEIDLSEKNAKALRDALAPWINVARRSGRVPSAAAAPTKPPRRSGEASAIRKWAEQNGIEVSTRGRISADLRARYKAAVGA
jgi:hypothetical protein